MAVRASMEPASVTVTSDDPFATARTSPSASTEATEPSPDDQTNSALVSRCPFASVASADRRTVSGASSVSLSGHMRMSAARCQTVIVALPVTSSYEAATSADPFDTAAASPVPSTATTESSPDAHVNSAPATGWPFASSAAAVSRAVSPRALRVSVGGVTVTSAVRWSTVTSTPPETPSVAAVTRALPGPAAVTRPAASTVSTASSSDAQVKAASSTGWPFASNASADSRTVSPIATSVSRADVTRTSAGCCRVVIVAVATASPTAASTVVAPFPAAVTRPPLVTVATAGSRLVQVTETSVMSSPYWSCTVADS
ncbi:MAG: hypothetical protein OXK74_14790 [Gemmatimonadota bacterium]|nr:hypothetical protein [Gemmatimonadota bacterium]